MQSVPITLVGAPIHRLRGADDTTVTRLTDSIKAVEALQRRPQNAGRKAANDK